MPGQEERSETPDLRHASRGEDYRRDLRENVSMSHQMSSEDPPGHGTFF